MSQYAYLSPLAMTLVMLCAAMGLLPLWLAAALLVVFMVDSIIEVKNLCNY